MAVLVSFNLASNRPDNLRALFDNLETTAADPACLEILVKIDIEDEAMAVMIAEERAQRPFAIKPLATPRAGGYFDLWKSLNALHKLCDPDAYFVCNINDEIRLKTQRWDTVLARYGHLFADDIFRLCTSVNKFRNYADFWECGYAPENYAFATKRWIDIQGDWNACHGPDAFQQFVSFYLTRVTWPAKEQYKRDVPIWDIAIGGEGIYKEMCEEDMWLRVQQGWRTWWRITSPAMQREARRRACHLAAHIWAHESAVDPYAVVERGRRVCVVRDETGRIERRFSWRVPGLAIRLTNWWRRPTKYHQCGGRPPPLRMWRTAILLRRWRAERRGQPA